MSKYYVLMSLRREIPLKRNLSVDFEEIGGIGCLFVFESLDALRDISPKGKYIEIENAVL